MEQVLLGMVLVQAEEWVLAVVEAEWAATGLVQGQLVTAFVPVVVLK